jgi:DNA-binding XRE family transcriptional regulator
MAEEKKEEKKEEQSKEKPAPKAKTEEKEKAQPAADVKKKTAEQSEGGKEKPDIQLSKKMQDVLSSIESMTVLELSNFVKALEEKFGVTAAQPMMMAGAAGAGAPGAQPAAEEKTTFELQQNPGH